MAVKLALWGYAVGVAGFYGIAYLRSRPAPASPAVSLPPPADTSAMWPKVSIIVPARDEERNIRTCVESLLAQDYPNFDVTVVDDGSSDGTAQILREIQRKNPQGRFLRVSHVDHLPAGWAGKPHAMHTGAAQADGAWLLFTDADTRHAPGALRFAVERASAGDVDLLSLGATQDLPDFWGRVLMPMAYLGISMQYPEAQVNNPRSPIAIANGQYMLVRASAYRAIGGYASARLRGTVLDDRDLAREIKHAGGRIQLIDGRKLLRTRMYHTLAEHWDGWGKNAYAGSRGGLPFYVLMLVGLPLCTIVPFFLGLGGLLTRRKDAALAGGLAASAALAYRAWLDRKLAVPPRYVWTQPLAGAIFTGILARSFWRSRTGRGVTWRGRTYHV
ncbi:MAG: Glycosyl transferase, family 2 [Ktedonobacterales bacterium]|jgi:chlorobactene glucosyltransferase|nr:MAG: Glycosyl transferase, family 2 [Ktedonobacterales bacterium]